MGVRVQKVQKVHRVQRVVVGGFAASFLKTFTTALREKHAFQKGIRARKGIEF